jgi:hypothetical protein
MKIINIVTAMSHDKVVKKYNLYMELKNETTLKDARIFTSQT